MLFALTEYNFPQKVRHITCKIVKSQTVLRRGTELCSEGKEGRRQSIS